MTTVAPAVDPRSLAGFNLFEGVEDNERRAIEQRCAWRWWPKGGMAIGRDTIGGGAHFVVAGRCRVVVGAPTGKRNVVLDEIGPGGFFGEMSAIDGERRSAAVTAMTRTRTAELDGKRFMEFLARHPPAALIVMRRLTEVIRQADTAILELSGLGAQTRVYIELLRRARAGGGAAPNTAVVAPVPKHADIALRAATARETVARALSDLARRGLARRDEDRLILCNLATLTRMARADPSVAPPASAMENPHGFNDGNPAGPE